jgi:hypothetical protein
MVKRRKDSEPDEERTTAQRRIPPRMYKEVLMTFSTKRNLGSDDASSWARSRPEPPHGGTVLFESEDGALAYAAWRLLGRRDTDMMWCPGPNAPGHPRCPLVERGKCDLVERADVVINTLGTADLRAAAVAEALDIQAEDGTPVVVVCEPDRPESISARLTRCAVVGGPVTRHLLTDIVERD